MKVERRGFLGFLVACIAANFGFVPAKGTADPEMASLENWHSYSEIYPNLVTTFNLYDRELVANLKSEASLFAQVAERRAVPLSAGVNRGFFHYGT